MKKVQGQFKKQSKETELLSFADKFQAAMVSLSSSGSFQMSFNLPSAHISTETEVHIDGDAVSQVFISN